MKIRLLLTVAGLAIGFALPTFAQQTDTPDPKLRERSLADAKKSDTAYNNNDPAAVAALYTENAVLVAPEGPIYGRDAIAKFWATLFQKVHFSNHLTTVDQYSPHMIGTAGNEMWATGEFRQTTEGLNLGNGYWSSISVREGDAWKIRLLAITPALPKFQVPSPAQQTSTPDPKLREQLIEGGKKYDDAFVKGDAAFLASCYTEDAVQVNDDGPIYGREAIEKHFENVFKTVHFSKHDATLDQYSPHNIGTAGDVMFATGEWSTTLEGQTPQGQHFGPQDEKGFWTCLYVREGDVWKVKVETWNRLKIYQ